MPYATKNLRPPFQDVTDCPLGQPRRLTAAAADEFACAARQATRVFYSIGKDDALLVTAEIMPIARYELISAVYDVVIVRDASRKGSPGSTLYCIENPPRSLTPEFSGDGRDAHNRNVSVGPAYAGMSC